ncbi:hypothetical protein GQ600_22171 [Phytophthora cactorum]|nr:hypothetical protein GQ600_22171 [Phytophthora cactorum]
MMEAMAATLHAVCHASPVLTALPGAVCNELLATGHHRRLSCAGSAERDVAIARSPAAVAADSSARHIHRPPTFSCASCCKHPSTVFAREKCPPGQVFLRSDSGLCINMSAFNRFAKTTFEQHRHMRKFTDGDGLHHGDSAADFLRSNFQILPSPRYTWVPSEIGSACMKTRSVLED